MKNILAIFGGLILIILVVLFVKFDLGTKYSQMQQLDSKALNLYMDMFEVVLKTGNSAEGMVRKVKINSEVTNEEVVEALNSIAIERGIKAVGDLPLSDEVEVRLGTKQPYVRILSYCSPEIAIKMVKFSKAYGAFLPCRIVIMEDEETKERWLYTMSMEIMLFGGKTLPDDMLAYGLKVRKTIYDMMDLAAEGEF